MTVREYIAGKFGRFGIELSDADYMDISFFVNISDCITKDNKTEVFRRLALDVIPFWKAERNSVEENGFKIGSMKDFDGFYDWLCKMAGVDNMLGSSITDKTAIW